MKAVIKTKKPARQTMPSPIHNGELKQIPIDKIDVSPLNYRKYFSETDLQEFAKELALHGIISPVTVRPGEGKVRVGCR